MLDLDEPTLNERLHRRTPEGRYEISEIDQVLNMRAQQGEGNTDGVRMLCTILLERCAPEFQRRTYGLRQRPELREEAIANMNEHLLREAMDPGEVFMTQNFIHYLRCLCADEFTRVLRQEGLHYRRDKEGPPSSTSFHASSVASPSIINTSTPPCSLRLPATMMSNVARSSSWYVGLTFHWPPMWPIRRINMRDYTR